MTPYEVLGVLDDATPAQITAAYRALAQKLHPDKGGSTEDMQSLQQAYEVLSDPDQRAIYDDTMHFRGHAGARISRAYSPNGGTMNEDEKLVRAPSTGGKVGGSKGKTIRTRRVEMPGRELVAEPVLFDSTRQPGAPINQVPKVRYAEAMKQREAGTLARSVLTEEGWVMPSDRGPIRRV